MEGAVKRKREDEPTVRVCLHDLNVVELYRQEDIELDLWTAKYVTPFWVYPPEDDDIDDA